MIVSDWQPEVSLFTLENILTELLISCSSAVQTIIGKSDSCSISEPTSLLMPRGEIPYAEKKQVLHKATRTLWISGSWMERRKLRFCQFCDIIWFKVAVPSFIWSFYKFLSDAEHQQADWIGIHQRICQLLVPIRTPTLFSLQRAGRIEIQLKKVRMYRMWCIGIMHGRKGHIHSEYILFESSLHFSLSSKMSRKT